MKNTIYQALTDRILAELDKGTVPWSQPWVSRAPVNAVSNTTYRGINTLLLNMAGFSDNRWLTYKQSADLGGNVKKGEKGTQIVFWKFFDGKSKDVDDQHQQKQIPLCRIYTVFNVSQCERVLVSDGGKLPAIEPISKTSDGSAIEAAQQLLENMPNAPHMQKSDHAAYVPLRDVVFMPDSKMFRSAAGYFSVLAHEICHSTGHISRLNRKAVTGKVLFGSEDYSEEELVAELGACFISGEMGIEIDIPNSAAYIENWRKALSNDNRLIVRAASQAQKSADYILRRSES